MDHNFHIKKKLGPLKIYNESSGAGRRPPPSSPFPKPEVEHGKLDFEISRTIIGKTFIISGVC